jgi:pimeloyl-ACP methyl ester carboxylesterase
MPAWLDSTDGVGVAVHDVGGPADPTTPVLVLVHPTGFNAGGWRPMAQSLVARGHRVVALDLRGHGLAHTPEGVDFAWDGFVDDVVAFLDSDLRPPGPLHGVGHSMGGASLLGAAERRPGAFRSLWLFEPITPPPSYFEWRDGGGDNPLAVGAEKRRPAFESVEAAIANYSSKPPMASFHPDALRGYVEGGTEPDPVGGGVRLTCRPEWEAATFRMAGGSPGWDAAAVVEIPVAVVVGEDTAMGPSAFGPGLAERLPAGRLVRHPELTHFGPFEEPAALAGEVATWVAGG